MKKLLLLLLFCPLALAQNPDATVLGGNYEASSYGGWNARVLTGNGPGVGVTIKVNGVVSTSKVGQIFPFAIGSPISIDTGASAETVTITNVAGCSAGAPANTCIITASFTKTHFTGAFITSATYGLQEAIGVAFKATGGTVVVDTSWHGTTAMLTAANGAASVAIADKRSGIVVNYGWNGSAYAIVAGGGGTITLPSAIVFGNGVGTPRASTSTDVNALYQTNNIVPTTVLNTTFNEGTVGATLAGTAPAVGPVGKTWQFGNGATAWTFQFGGGVTAPTTTGSPFTGGAFIDVGVSNYTLNIAYTSIAGSSLVMLRYTDPNNLVFANLTPGGVQIFNQVGGAQTAISNVLTLNTASLQIIVSGQTVTITDGVGHGPFASAIPVGTNTSATNVGFATYSGAGGVVSSMSVISGTHIVTSACAGALFGDGVCRSVVAPTTNVMSGSSTATALSMPELGTTDNGNGTASVAWHEDKLMGNFDCRDPKYGPGGCLGPNPGQALQDLSTDLICYAAIHGLKPTVYFPPGILQVGTPAFPALIFPAGANYYGKSGIGTFGAGYTVFQATYNGHTALQFNTNQSAVCPDGITHTETLTDGKYIGFAEHGCSQGGCVNVPGDTGGYPFGGQNQDGIFIGDSQGWVDQVSTSGNGGDGLIMSGQDTHTGNLWSQGDLAWYILSGGKVNPNGAAYVPASDPNIHGGLVLSTTDGFFSGPNEVYGLNQAVGNEYGHIAGIAWSGGNSELNNVFVQLTEIGVYRLGGAINGRASGWRIDAARGVGIFEAGGSDSIVNILVTSACRDAGVAALNGGHCDYISDGGGQSYFQGHVSNDPFFGADHSTGFIIPGGQSTFDFPVPSGAVLFETIPGNSALFNNTTRYQQPSLPSGGLQVTGPAPSVAVGGYIHPSDTSPINYTGVSNANIMQDVWILGGNANVTLLSGANGGKFVTCDGNNLNLGALAQHHFIVTSGTDNGNPPVLTQQCDGGGSSAVSSVNTRSGAVTGLSDLTVSTLQTHAGAVNGPSFNNIYGVESYPSSCTVASVSYTTQLDCAFYTLKNAGFSGVLHLGSNANSGTYQTCAGLVEPTTGGQISIVGEMAADNVQPGTNIKATCAIQAIISHPDVANGTSLPYALRIENINLDANNNAQQCLAIYAEQVGYQQHIHCRNALSATKAWVEIGDANPAGGFQGFGFQNMLDDIFVAGHANAQPNWATVTPTQTAGVPSIAVNTAGSYLNAAPPVYLYGFGAGALPCTVMPTLTAVMAGTGPFTLTSITVTGGSGCAGTLYAYVPDLQPAPYGIQISTTDSTIKDMVVANVGQVAGLDYEHGGNTIIHDHVYSGSPILIRDVQANMHVGAEGDSATHYNVESDSKYASWYGTQFTWAGGTPQPGASGFFTTTEVHSFGSNCGAATTNSNGFNLLVYSASGPVAHGNTTSYGPSVIMGGIQCDNLSSVTAIPNMEVGGQLSMVSGIVNQDNAAADILGVGTGANISNSFSISARSRVGFLATPGTLYLQGKSGVDILTGLTIGTGKVGGWGLSGIPEVSIGTVIASATTIAPTTAMVHVSGTVSVSTITAPVGCTVAGIGCTLTIIPDAAVPFITGGNIQAALTATINIPVMGVYDPAVSKWFLK